MVPSPAMDSHPPGKEEGAGEGAKDGQSAELPACRLAAVPLAKLRLSAPPSEQQLLAEELWAQGVVEYVLGNSQGQMGAGVETFAESLKADPRNPKRHYFLGCITSAFHHKGKEAAICFENAIAADPSFALAYQELVMLYEAWGNFEAARTVARRAIEKGVRWQDEWQRPPSWTPGLTANAWWDRQQFQWGEELEAAWEDIRDEALRLRGGCKGQGMPQAWSAVGSETATHDADIVSGGEWREFVLFGANVPRGPDSEAARSCPKTVEAIERLLPAAVAMAQLGVGEIIFSALAPGTRLLPHCASSNVRLTCHLGLVCPKGARIKVGPTWGEWEEGRCIFFDDSFLHEIANDSDQVRIVLLIRFWHPELELDKVMPILEQGVQDFEDMNRLRMSPPMTALAAVKVNEAMAALSDSPQTSGQQA